MVNLPNLLSLYRLVLTPIVVIMLLREWPAYGNIVAVLTASAWLSDMLDGAAARILRQSSSLGALLDWTADKVFVLSVFIALMVIEQVPPWVVITIVAREIVVTEVRHYCATKNITEIVGSLGKVKLGASMSTIITLALRLPSGKWFLYLTLVLTIVSAVDYFVKAARHLSSAASERG